MIDVPDQLLGDRRCPGDDLSADKGLADGPAESEHVDSGMKRKAAILSGDQRSDDIGRDVR